MSERRFPPPDSTIQPPSSISQTMLDYLDRNNLFVVPLDTRSHWYRYHHLFADLLRRRLDQSRDAQEVAALHLRASHWCAQEGHVAEAVSHALAAPDLDWATTLIERHAPDFASRGESVLAESWLDALPEERLRTSPYLCILCVSRDSLAPLEVLEGWLGDAERAWAARMEHEAAAPDEVEELRFRGWMAATRAWARPPKREARRRKS